MKRTPVLHPFFFILYTVLFLYIQNIGQVSFQQTYRSFVVLLVFAGILLLVLGLAFRNWQRAGLVTTFGLLLFMSLGHVHHFLLTEHPAVSARWLPYPVLLAIWGLAFLIGIILIFMVKNAAPVTRMLNIVCAFLLIMAGANLALDTPKNPRPETTQASATAKKKDTAISSVSSTPQTIPSNLVKPDIYYIILDGYGQAKMLQDIYGFDDSAFISELKNLGFYVAEDSHSNYNQTLLSLPSSMNMNYLQDLLTLDPQQGSRDPLVDLLRNSEVARQLQQQGYHTIAMSTGYEWTDLTNADSYVNIHQDLNEFETMLISSTAAESVVSQAQFAARRLAITDRFRSLDQIASQPGPKFVFAHMVVPHPPFLFDRNGLPVTPNRLSFGDGSDSGLDPETYKRLYEGQALHINNLTLQMLKLILARSKNQAMIILQGDHGPGAYLNWHSLEKSCFRERLSILNAYYLPDGKTPQEVGLYSSITPVNSFRLILNAYLGAHYPIVEERSYFSLWKTPYNYQDVTSRLSSCSPLGK